MTIIDNLLKNIRDSIPSINVSNEMGKATKALIILEQKLSKVTKSMAFINADPVIDIVITTDTTFFDEGSFDINRRGRENLERFISNRIKRIKNLQDSLKIDITEMKIISVGYADSQGFRSDYTPNQLLKISNKQLPYPQKHFNEDGNRKFLNQILSQERAKTVYKIAENYFKDKRLSDPKIDGKGEIYPSNKVAYSTIDDRRKICILTILPVLEKN